MSSYDTSSSTALMKTIKPVNIFYVWYTELCRRLCSQPSPAVKPAKPKSQTVLDFVADRLKADDWHPLITALRNDTSLHVIVIKSRLGNYQFMHDIDTEEKLKQMKRRTGCLWTAFIQKSLLKSLSCTIRNSQVLTCLEFDGLPLFAQYLEPLMKALQKNSTLKALSLSRCRISDPGCQMVCSYVRFIPNIEVLNLSGCALTWESGEHLAKLIKYQQINRYCESWHNSLRYADPNIQVMRGIKRITLNGNPLFGDEGLVLILNELEDDLWMKALDMQKCGLTENISKQVLDVVQYSQSLEIVDFRLNDELSISTIEKILNLLKQKRFHNNTEYQWCNTTFTLTCESIIGSMSNYTTSRSVKPNQNLLHKVKSAPMTRPVTSCNQTTIRKTKTTECVNPNRKTTMAPIASTTGNDSTKLLELNQVLLEQMTKRRGGGDSMKTTPNYQPNGICIPELKFDESDTMIKKGTIKKTVVHTTNGYKNGVVKKKTKDTNSQTNGFFGSGENNSQTVGSETASTIFERIINQDHAEDESGDDESLLDLLQEQNQLDKNHMDLSNNTGLSSSQISLVKFMEDLKMKQHTGPVVKSKYYITKPHE